MTARGIGLVARQEIRTRLRAGRWKALLAVWFAVVNGLGLMYRLTLESEHVTSRGSAGVPMFGGVLLGVLVLTLLVTPALGGQTVNGDRERGTLATLQVTRLTPAEITLGKLAAAWGTGLLALLLTLPSVLWPVAEGAVGPWRALVTLLVTGLLIGVVCAVSQCWSALLARSVTSVLLSYLTVFGLIVGTPLLFTIAVPLASAPPGPGDYAPDRTDRVWWLLAPNPVVVLADAAPRLPGATVRSGDVLLYTRSQRNDPLGQLSRGVRDIRAGGAYRSEKAPVWPFGLAFDLALAGGAVWLTARRLRTPVQAVPKGVRLA